MKCECGSEIFRKLTSFVNDMLSNKVVYSSEGKMCDKCGKMYFAKDIEELKK